MGDLRRKLPVTFWTFITGTLALAGVPLLSGFYSKDSILAQAAHHNIALFIVGSRRRLADYVLHVRLVFIVFFTAGTNPTCPLMRTRAAGDALAVAPAGPVQHRRRLHWHRRSLRPVFSRARKPSPESSSSGSLRTFCAHTAGRSY